MKFLIRLLIAAAVIFAVAYFSNGALLRVSNFGWAIVLAIVLGIVNAVIRPIVNFFSLPVNILTLGLFSLVINALMLAIAAALTPGVQTAGFWATVLAALIISVVTSLADSLVDRMGTSSHSGSYAH